MLSPSRFTLAAVSGHALTVDDDTLFFVDDASAVNDDTFAVTDHLEPIEATLLTAPGVPPLRITRSGG